MRKSYFRKIFGPKMGQLGPNRGFYSILCLSILVCTDFTYFERELRYLVAKADQSVEKNEWGDYGHICAHK